MLSYPNSWTKLYTIAKVVKRFFLLGVFNLLHSSCYKRWRATLIALMSSAECSQLSHNEICSRRNRPERLGRTLGHMAETAVISMAGGWMLQIGKRLSHPGLWPWWRVLEKDSPESSTQNMILSFYRCSARKLTYSVCSSSSVYVTLWYDRTGWIIWNHSLISLTFMMRNTEKNYKAPMIQVNHFDGVLCRARE